MGGADEVGPRLERPFDDVAYRWGVEVLNHVVFADPDHAGARELLADAHEQLGYQAEAGAWRNIYLTASKELRDELPQVTIPSTASPDSIRAMTLELLFNFLGVKLNGPKAGGSRISLNLVFTDTGEKAVLELTNGSLNHSIGRTDDAADATIPCENGARPCAARRGDIDRGGLVGEDLGGARREALGRVARASRRLRPLVQQPLGGRQ